MALPNKVYDVLKWIALVVLPAIGALYFGLAQIWGLPYGEEIVGTLTVIDTFLGALLGLSSKNYEGDGTLYVDKSREDKDIVRVDFAVDPATVSNKRKFVLKVDPDAKLESVSEPKIVE